MIRKVFLIYMMGIVSIGVPANTNAQKTKAITKAIQAITKKRPKGKAANPPKPPKNQNTKPIRPTETICTNCEGYGYKNGKKCSKCDGKGKKKKFV